MKDKSTGIVFIATGAPEYGCMAAALAASILATEYISISLYYHGNAIARLSDAEKNLFASVELLPDKYIMNGVKKLPFKPKVYLHKITPYKQTLYLDVDMGWNPAKKVSELIKSFGEREFVTICEGYNNANKRYQTWANIDDIKRAYNVTDIPQTRTELIYFEKNEVSNAIFSKAAEVFLKPLVNFSTYGSHTPDELAFNISCALNGYKLDKFSPIYWHYLHKGVKWNSNYAYSMGGAVTSTEQKRIYNGIIQNAYYKLGLQRSYKYIDKKYFAKNYKVL